MKDAPNEQQQRACARSEGEGGGSNGTSHGESEGAINITEGEGDLLLAPDALDGRIALGSSTLLEETADRALEVLLSHHLLCCIDVFLGSCGHSTEQEFTTFLVALGSCEIHGFDQIACSVTSQFPAS